MVEVDADFRGDVGPDRVRLELPRRRFGVKSHEDPEIFFRWGGDWSSMETLVGCLLWCGRRGRKRGSGVAPAGLQRAATGGDAAVRRRGRGGSMERDWRQKSRKLVANWFTKLCSIPDVNCFAAWSNDSQNTWKTANLALYASVCSCATLLAPSTIETGSKMGSSEGQYGKGSG